ncbi:MAG: 16S rRNA (guanine(527)-N(7))-methyltransferase RsmG, partial [Bacillota bacterium]
VARPDLKFTLLDSNGKKTRFMTHAAAALTLKNVDVVQARAEAWRPPAPFALVLSRAFASLRDFILNAGGHCVPGGRLLAMKGARPEEELRDIPPGYRVQAVHPLKVPGLAAERCLVEIVKEAV